MQHHSFSPVVALHVQFGLHNISEDTKLLYDVGDFDFALDFFIGSQLCVKDSSLATIGTIIATGKPEWLTTGPLSYVLPLSSHP